MRDEFRLQIAATLRNDIAAALRDNVAAVRTEQITAALCDYVPAALCNDGRGRQQHTALQNNGSLPLPTLD